VPTSCPVIESIKAAGGQSLRQIAAGLNDQGITTPRGGEWSAVQVKRALWAARWYHVHQEQREWAGREVRGHQQRLSERAPSVSYPGSI
jgi:hypothetical protein